MLVAWFLAGCSSHGDDPPVTVPSSPALSAPSGSGGPTPTASGTTPRDQVITAYEGYWAATERAATVPVAQVRQVLQPYSTGPVIEDQIKGIRALQAKNQEPWGKINLGVYAVDVKGPTAQVRDCQDTSGAGLADRRTHQLIPSTRGRSKPYNLSATLQRGSDARWRVSNIGAVEKPCTPPNPSGA